MSMPMIAITTSNSTSVKPDFRRKHATEHLPLRAPIRSPRELEKVPALWTPMRGWVKRLFGRCLSGGTHLEGSQPGSPPALSRRKSVRN